MKTSDKPLCGSICNRWGWFCQLCPWLHSLFFYFSNTKENVIYFMRVSHMIGWISHMIAHFVSIYQFICVLIQMTGLWLGLKSSCPFNLTNIIVIEHTVTSNQRRRHPDWLLNSLFRPTTKQTPKLPPPPPPPPPPPHADETAVRLRSVCALWRCICRWCTIRCSWFVAKFSLGTVSRLVWIFSFPSINTERYIILTIITLNVI